jgi:high-affinity iron transporter
MLPAFVIGLREGLEAALIVSIIAAFLRQHGRLDALRWVFAGVLLASALCLAAGIGLHMLERNLPQLEQERLETVVGLVAVAVVTYMVVWMRRHARSIKGALEESAGAALAQGSVVALVAMAFLAVLREGLETAVFLVATFQNSTSPQSTGGGAAFGIAVAVVIGVGIYRGGVQINLSRFFRFTGLLLVLVAAGLVSSALHSGHEGGWVNSFQGTALDLNWLVRPGTVSSALVTGMFGIQPKPTVIEVMGWLLYAVPVGLYVVWPQRARVIPRTQEHREALATSSAH